MKDCVFTVTENRPIARDVFRMSLSGDVSEIAAPGQFVNLKLGGFYLRRPISVCDLGENSLTLIYKTVGAGTEALSRTAPGSTLAALTGLGNGYDLQKAGRAPLLLGGGVGVTTLYLPAKRLIAAGKAVTAVLGFNTAADVFYAEEFRALGCAVAVTTADGSLGQKGFVTDALPETYSYFYACGPEPMLRAVCAKTRTGGQLSLEERMGCGFGACMGCSRKTKNGYKRVCKDGPVFTKEELIWDD